MTVANFKQKTKFSFLELRVFIDMNEQEIKLEILKIAERLHTPDTLDYLSFCHFIDDLYKFVIYDYQYTPPKKVGG